MKTNMNKLIFHSTNKLKSVSQFDEEIIKLVSGNDIKIACPYINIYYLQKLIKLSTSWVLLTDINEWIGSVKSQLQIKQIQEFINSNKGKIKHCDDLHAKTILTNKEILLGSANLTDKGIFKRNEVSVILNTQDDVTELNSWFDDWYKNSDFVNLQSLEAYTKSKTYQPKSESERPIKIQKSSFPIRTSSFQDESKKSENQKTVVTKSEIEHYLNKWKNNEWEYQFFKLINKAIEITGYENGSDYLAITLTKAKEISVQLNNRYILKSHYYNKSNLVSLMLPLSFDEHKEKYKNIIHEINYFTKNKEPQKIWTKFKVDNPKILSDEILLLWELAILKEKERKYFSPYRKYHQPFLYDLAIDELELNSFFKQAMK